MGNLFSYASTSFEEVVYCDVLEGAKKLGVKVILLLGTTEGVPDFLQQG
ncbi:hypothetical protein BH11PAT4_BH11PAT4_3530 [soil metagenome]